MEDSKTYTAFAGDQVIASGPLKTMLRQVKELLDRGKIEQVLIFEDETGRQVDFNFRGTLEEFLEREAPVTKHAGPGRPKLGVVCREVSLLPRHWEWLEQQPNGASAALRRLVEEARKRDPEKERLRLATEAASRFMSAMAGNLAGFEEASRALFARDLERFDELIRNWPDDIRRHVLRLAKGSTPQENEPLR
jgi:hypothetical protein